MIKLINQLTAELKKPLPGISQQLLLASQMHRQIKPDKNKQDAAVLILIFKNTNNEPSIVLMKRAAYNGPHGSQISFPGGKFENIDLSLKNTALRETGEELGINTDIITIIGQLTELYIPVSNFLVFPFVGYTKSELSFNIDKNEVDYLVPASLKSLMKIEVSETSWNIENREYKIPYYNIQNEMVWGATAMMLSEFIKILQNATQNTAEFIY